VVFLVLRRDQLPFLISNVMTRLTLGLARVASQEHVSDLLKRSDGAGGTGGSTTVGSGSGQALDVDEAPASVQVERLEQTEMDLGLRPGLQLALIH